MLYCFYIVYFGVPAFVWMCELLCVCMGFVGFREIIQHDTYSSLDLACPLGGLFNFLCKTKTHGESRCCSSFVHLNVCTALDSLDF